ncbi:MAG: CHASE2 domain-containing protein [FCB group bacterium]|nr:CHASE2 domain-containing protein [FCB group bacterium]
MNKYSSYILFLLITLFVVILSLNHFGPLDKLQLSINDFLCRITASANTQPNIAIVSIDGKAQDEFGNWPWNYDRVADLLAAVATGKPKAIVLNFFLNENLHQDSAGYTDILAGQLSWINNLVVPYDIALSTFRNNRTNNPKHLFNYSLTVDNPLGLMNEKSSLQVRKVFLPAQKILENDPGLGFDYTMPDEDRVVRYQSLVMNYEGYYYPSLSLLGAAIYLNVSPDQIKIFENKEIKLGQKRTIPINNKSECFINYPKDNTFIKYSAADVLNNGFNFNKLKNKLVVVNVDDFSINQFFKTPVNKQVSESFIKASVMDNIINNNMLTIKNDQILLNLIILFILGGICAFIMPQVSLLYRLLILGSAFIILLNINYFLLSSFKIIPETIYFGLELILFMVASPLLDSQLLTGKVKKPKIVNTTKAPFKKGKKESATSQEFVPVREIKESPNDPENQETTILSDQERNCPQDHHTINLNDNNPKFAEKTEMVDSSKVVEETKTTHEQTPKSVKKPEIISPDSDSPDKTTLSSPETEQRAQDNNAEIILSQTTGNKITHLGRYQITGILGKGAMGQVYKGVDPAINRPVALKTIRLDFVSNPEEMAELKERLFREAQAAGKLSHPNIVTIYDVGSEGNLQYIAMEYLEGQTLEQMTKKKVKFNYSIISKIIIQICNALEYAHEKGIVHRDIKPANIMVLKDYTAKVMDYGIARIDSNSMTKTGIAMGTPNYISPEQLQGKKVDHRADIFSLGVVIYEMLLGRRPFKGENITSLIYAILNHEPDKPSNVNPQIPLLFDHIIDKALKKNPDERYQNARDLAADLHDFVESFAS